MYKDLSLGVFSSAFFSSSKRFLFRPKSISLFVVLCFSYIHQFLLKTDVCMFERVYCPENKTFYRSTVRIFFFCGHFSFFGGNTDHIFHIKFRFLIRFEINKWLNSFRVVFKIHDKRTFFMPLCFLLTFSLLKYSIYSFGLTARVT